MSNLEKMETKINKKLLTTLSLENEISICLKVIENYFSFLKIMGTGFMAILGVNTLVKDIFGELITKGVLIAIVFVIMSLLLTVFRKFAIIKALREKENSCKK